MSVDTEIATFEQAAAAALKFLRNRYGFGLWMINRLRQDRWVVLHVEDTCHGIAVGDEFRWSDPIGSRMMQEQGPRIAARVADVRGCVDASLRERLGIKAYIGIPLCAANGRFLGTLCAIDTEEHPELDESELPLLELLAAMLAGYFRSEIEATDRARRDERFRFEAMTDALTHLPNRRAWEEKLDREENRSIRMGDSTFISVIGVGALAAVNARDGRSAGDELLRKTSLVLRYVVRNSDFVARIGSDQFAVLGIQCDSVEPDDISDRIRTALAQAGIGASVGTAVARPSDSNAAVWRKAGAALPDRKARRSHGCRPA